MIMDWNTKKIINVKVLQIYTSSAQEVLRKGREIYVVF